jgi:hypothetical protein
LRSPCNSLEATARAWGRVRARQDDRELVAAEAADDVGFAQSGAENARRVRDQPIADRVPERVVDVLEMVDVDQDQCAVAGFGERPVELELEPAAIEQPCHRVVVR